MCIIDPTLAATSAEVCRALDVNANRASEGLRVVEDYLRFCCQDRFLSLVSKQLRHDLTEALRGLAAPPPWWTCRSTLTDVGTQISTVSEQRRETPLAVAMANIRRVTEALRSLEEFSKISYGSAAGSFESLRYRAYTLEKALHHAQRARLRLGHAHVYVLVDLARGRDDFERRAKLLIEAGVDVLQLRDKSLSDRELLEAARVLRSLTQEANTLLVINDRPDVAVVVKADGVHVGQDEMRVADVRTVVGPEMLIGVSTHSLEQARMAVLEGADYIGVGPVFPSHTKSFSDYPGLELVRQVFGEIGLPAFAIGGITLDRSDALLRAGGVRVAVRDEIWNANEPAQVLRQFQQRFCEQQGRMIPPATVDTSIISDGNNC